MHLSFSKENAKMYKLSNFEKFNEIQLFDNRVKNRKITILTFKY
jgi:hypothetical protein